MGKLNYLEQISQPDICNAVHQCAKYSSNSHAEHTEAIVYLANYLNGTLGLGFCFYPINQIFVAIGIRNLQMLIQQQQNHDLHGLLLMLAIPFGGPQKFRLMLQHLPPWLNI